MSSNNTRTGIAGTATFHGGTSINQSHNTTYNYHTDPNDSNNKIVGIFPHDDSSHNVPGEHRDHFIDALSEFKKLLGASKDDPRQQLIVIHGPIWTGKSTFAHMLMSQDDFGFTNRIWIDSESQSSVNNNFLRLYNDMRMERNLERIEDQDSELMMRWIYTNLLAHPTLLVFDNAAILNFDQTSCVSKFYCLMTYLPMRSWLDSKGLIPPTVVVTTRATLCKTSPIFLLSFLKLPDTEFIPQLAEHLYDQKLSTEEKLMDALNISHKLRSDAFSALSLLELESKSILLELITHMCCSQVEGQQQADLEMTHEKVEQELVLLQGLSMVTINNGYVCLLPAMRKHINKNRRTVELPLEVVKPLVGVFSDLVKAPPGGKALNLIRNLHATPNLDLTKWNWDLTQVDRLARNVSLLISILYPAMMKYEIATSEAFKTFGFFGNSYESQYGQLRKIRDEFFPDDDDSSSSYSSNESSGSDSENAYSDSEDEGNSSNCTSSKTEKYNTKGEAEQDVQSGSKDNFFESVEDTVEEEFNVISEILDTDDDTILDAHETRFSSLIGRVQRGDFKTALDGYDDFKPDDLNLGPMDVSHLLFEAECNLKVGRYTKALSTVSLVKNVSSYHDHYYSALPAEAIKVSVLVSQGRFLEARNSMDSALLQSVRLNGRQSYTTVALEHILAKMELHQGNTESALELIDHVLSVRRQFDGVTTARYIKAVATKAKILVLRGDFEAASGCLKSAKSEFIAKRKAFSDLKDEDNDSEIENHPFCLILRYYQAKIFCSRELFDESLAIIKAASNVIDNEKVTDPENYYRFRFHLLKASVFARIENTRMPSLRNLCPIHNYIFDGIFERVNLKHAANYLNLLSIFGDEGARPLAVKTFQTLEEDSEVGVGIRIQVEYALAAIKKREEENDYLLPLRKIVDESVKSAGPFHVRTLEYKRKLVEALLDNTETHLSEANNIIRSTLDFLQSSGYGKLTTMNFNWRLLRALVLFEVDPFVETDSDVKFLLDHLPPSHPICRAVKYAKACHEARRGQYETAYEGMFDVFHSMLESNAVHSIGPDFGEVTVFLAFLRLQKFDGEDECKETFHYTNTSLWFAKSLYGKENNRSLLAQLNTAILCLAAGKEENAIKIFTSIESSTADNRIKDYAQHVKKNYNLTRTSGSISQEFNSKLYYRRGEICHKDIQRIGSKKEEPPLEIKPTVRTSSKIGKLAFKIWRNMPAVQDQQTSN